MVVAEHPETIANDSFFRDWFNITIGIVWQTALAATGVYLVIEDYRSLSVALAVILVTTLILKLQWYDKLEDYPADLHVDESAGQSS